MPSKTNAKALRDADPDNRQPIPVDLVTASASGLDPDISPAAAYYQAARVARARNLAVEQVEALIDGARGGPALRRSSASGGSTFSSSIWRSIAN